MANPYDLVTLGFSLVDKLIPDPQAKQQAQLKLLELQQQGDLADLNAQLQLASNQADINKIEASNPNLFVSGGRPAIIWVGAISLACYYVPYALVSTGLWAYESIQVGHLLPRPEMGIGDLLGLIMPLLGVAGLRSLDKFNGVASK